MRREGSKRAGKAAFALLLLSALALAGFLLWRQGLLDLSGWFSNTAGLDENGYYSDYDARLGVEAPATVAPPVPARTPGDGAQGLAQTRGPVRPTTPVKP